MRPFKVYNRETKVTWLILNYHPTPSGGEYLAAREDDSNQDGELEIIQSSELKKLKLVGFLEEYH